MSPENQKLWNRHGLVATNGTITISIPALERLLDSARVEGRSAHHLATEPIPIAISCAEQLDRANSTWYGKQ